jgi:GTP-binding protein Era
VWRRPASDKHLAPSVLAADVGTAARTHIKKLPGAKVYLDLRVKIARNWQPDPKQLGRLGF